MDEGDQTPDILDQANQVRTNAFKKHQLRRADKPAAVEAAKQILDEAKQAVPHGDPQPLLTDIEPGDL